MKLLRTIAGVAALFSTTWASANVVPKLTPDALLARADVAGIVRITGVFEGHLPGSVEEFGCWNATPLALQKGASDRDLVMCLGGIAEKNPRPPAIGQACQVCLQRAPSGVLFPITKDSWIPVQR